LSGDVVRKAKHETIELDLDPDALKFLNGVAKHTVHDKTTVLEVLIGLWAWKEISRRKERDELCP
jgi:hypothetical protein